MKNKKNSRILRHFLYGNMIILILPLLMSITIYYQSAKIIEKDIKDTNTLLLEQTINSIDYNLSEMERIIGWLGFNEDVNRLLYQNDLKERETINLIQNVSKTLRNYRYDKRLIEDFILYFNNTGVYINSNTIYTKTNQFYENGLIIKDMDKEDWVEYINLSDDKSNFKPLQSGIYEEKQLDIILYQQKIPFENRLQHKGKILAMVNNGYLKEQLKQISTVDEGFAYIIDSNNQVMTTVSAGDKQSIQNYSGFTDKKGFYIKDFNNNKMLVTYVKSSFNDWLYVVGMPYNIVMERLINIKRLLMIIILMILMLGFTLSFFFAYKNSKPFYEIIKMISKDKDEEIDSFNTFNDAIEDMVADNQKMKGIIEENSKNLRIATFEQIINGKYYEVQELNQAFVSLNIPIEANHYIIMIVNLNDEKVSKDVVDVNKVMVVNDLNEHLKIKYIHNMNFNSVCVLLCAEEKDKIRARKQCESYISSFKDRMFDMGIDILHVSVGKVVSEYIDVTEAFETAIEVNQYQRQISSKSIMTYEEISSNNDYCYYPIKLEEKLINLVKIGNITEIQTSLLKVLDENTKVRQLTGNQIKQLKIQIVGTLYRIIGQINNQYGDINFDEGQLKNLSAIDDFSVFLGKVSQIYTILCNSLVREKDSQMEQLKEDIENYVQTNYRDATMSLSLLSTVFKYSEVYISKLFKEEVGVNFSGFLEELRIKKSYEYLENTKKNIEEISIEVGYSSAHVFRRAFKRVSGLTPRQYRALKKD